MCLDPASAALLATQGGTASTAIGGLSSIFQLGSGLLGAYAVYQNSQAQAAALKQTAELQEIAAAQEIKRGEDESDRRRRAGAIQIGEQRAAMAANGVDVTGELALDLLDDTSTLIAEDAFSIRENARRNAQGLLNQAANSRTQAANASPQGKYGAIGTILTTGAKVGPKFSHMRNKKPFDPWANWRTVGAY